MTRPLSISPLARDSFLWGAATSCYQIEGGVHVDGRGPSIWDTFCARDGTIADGSSGESACDHYHRWREDLGWLKWLGVDAYRFSIAWPRVMPNGAGEVNEAGLSFYDRLVDELMNVGITPLVTLYHWDLPQALENEGGWRHRATCQAFEAYTYAVCEKLGDRVRLWNTINEPWCAAMLGHESGVHAPGRKSKSEALRVAHHLLLAHGTAVRVIREQVQGAKVGIAHMYVDCMPASESEADKVAASRLDGYFNRWFLDPLYARGYPRDMMAQYQGEMLWETADAPFVQDNDMELIASPTDFIGLNYYTRAIVRSEEIGEKENAPRLLHEPPDDERTDMGWEVYPEGLRRALLRVHDDYAPPSVVVTENGAAYDTGVNDEGAVPDTRRVNYLTNHIDAVARAAESGVPVDGYFAWSLLDNFEWALGLEKRFGLIHVDFTSQRRTPKESANWYRHLIAQAKGKA